MKQQRTSNDYSRAQSADSNRKQIMTMRSKNLYLKEDPALVAMYERRISVRDLQFWLRKHPSQLSERLAQKMRLLTDH